MQRCVTLKRQVARGLSGAQISGLSMLAVAAVAGAVYARALGFGFFNDDPSGHFAWMEGVSALRLFTSSAGYGFYRPLTFAIWKLLLALFGHYDGPGFHALPVALHAANAGLLWLLAFRLTGRSTYAWAAALFFALFPFSYEAVAYVAAMFHPLLAFWALLTLLLYQRARQTGATRYLAAAYLTLLLGLFTHENGVVIPVLLLAWELAQPALQWGALAKQPARWFFAAPLLFPLLWRLIPQTSGPGGLQPPAAFAHNTLPFLQVIVYPLLPLFRVRASSPWLLVGLAAVVAALMYAIAHYSRLRQPFVFAAWWLACASLPAMLLLPPAYVYGSPRLCYLASIGAALLWALPVLALERLASGRALRRYSVRGLQLLVGLCILVSSLPFIQSELYFYDLASQVVRAMAANAAAAAPGREVVLVNVPFYFSSGPRSPSGYSAAYPFAPTGAVVMPPYAAARDFVRVNGGPDRAVRTVVFKGYNPGWNTHGAAIDGAGLRGYVENAEVYVFDLVRWAWFDLSSAWQFQAPAAHARRATFDLVDLDDVSVEKGPNGFKVSLRWQVLQPPTQPLTVFVHLYDASGVLAAQHDGPPAQGYAPVSLWQANDVIVDVHDVVPERPLAPGTYTLAAGLYDPGTGQRLPAYSAEHSALADNVYVIGQVTWP